MAHTDEEHSEAQLLELLLAARDIPCPVCGYNLRAIASTNCPECGAKLDLRVGSTDLKLGPWLAALLAGALPLGIVSFVLVIGLAVDPIFFAVFFVGALAYIMLLALVVRNRRAFWKQPRKRQWWLAVCSAIVSLVLLLVVFMMVVLLAI
ncbi:MAG: hypothetical protein O7F17_04115 [Planctomycetota bacterium]|nr:hypothetical protein [Planctomycetota bacterium]